MCIFCFRLNVLTLYTRLRNDPSQWLCIVCSLGRSGLKNTRASLLLRWCTCRPTPDTQTWRLCSDRCASGMSSPHCTLLLYAKTSLWIPSLLSAFTRGSGVCEVSRKFQKIKRQILSFKLFWEQLWYFM